MKLESITPIQWMYIDIANYAGKDKLNYEDRIQWVCDNKDQLEQLVDQADKPARYIKAVQALRNVELTRKTKHLVALDASSSGIQILSALTKCKVGCENTNLLGGSRKDAYSIGKMLLDRLTKTTASRAEFKDCIMHSCYGGIATVAETFPDPRDQEMFWEVLDHLVPGATSVLNVLLSTWDSQSDIHQWIMPDNHHVYIPVLLGKRLELTHEDLDGTPIVIRYDASGTSEFERANCANITHSQI